MFADTVELKIKAGKGGDGRLSFRQEKYRAKGGPDGGDGGRGGNVIFRVDHNLNTLAAFRKNPQARAADGGAGGADRRHGKNGEDVIVKIPAGTQIYNGEELLADLTNDGQEAVIARGGRGGFGNAHFTSSTRQTPRVAELGERGDELTVQLELKLVADIGLVGLPNAGKSTLLSVISNARPEIGDYPFTTLTPNLGVVDIDETSVLVADIPGLIEGASQGKGLGDQFLRHVERTAVLLHLVDMTSETITTDYTTIIAELRSYQIDLTDKPRLLVPTKVDAVPAHLLDNRIAELRQVAGLDMDAPLHPISAQAHQGLTQMLRTALPIVLAERTRRAAVELEEAIPVIDESTQPDLWTVEKIGDVFVVRGEKLEGFARRTNWDNEDAVERLRDILRKQGVARELKRQGAEGEAEIQIGDHSLRWLD